MSKYLAVSNNLREIRRLSANDCKIIQLVALKKKNCFKQILKTFTIAFDQKFGTACINLTVKCDVPRSFLLCIVPAPKLKIENFVIAKKK